MFKFKHRESMVLPIIIMLIVVGLLLLLASCMATDGQVPNVYGVRDVRLEDGTRCVVYYNGGIDCDWR